MGENGPVPGGDDLEKHIQMEASPGAVAHEDQMAAAARESTPEAEVARLEMAVHGTTGEAGAVAGSGDQIFHKLAKETGMSHEFSPSPDPVPDKESAQAAVEAAVAGTRPEAVLPATPVAETPAAHVDSDEANERLARPGEVAPPVAVATEIPGAPIPAQATAEAQPGQGLVSKFKRWIKGGGKHV